MLSASLGSRPASLPIPIQNLKPLCRVHTYSHHANNCNTPKRSQVRDTRDEKESCCLVWSRIVFYFLFCNLLSSFIIRNLNSCFARINLFPPLSMSGIKGKSRWSYEIWISIIFSETTHPKKPLCILGHLGPDTTLEQPEAFDCAGPRCKARARLGFVTFQVGWSQ